MKKTLIVLFVILSIIATGQENATEQAKPIVVEGKRLYRSEMASWYGTDIFLEKYTQKENVGGYFSYSENNINKCIFFSKGDNPKVIGTILFDSTYNTKTAKTNLIEREFTVNENDLYLIRKKASNIIGSDTLFKVYKNTDLNLIPLIYEDEKKVYILTGPKENDVVIFGNDYLLTFNKDNQLIGKKQLHRNIIPINYGEKQEKEMTVERTIHSHLPETGDFITATDICTLMLYEKFTKWKQHNVTSKNYLNIWNCLTDELVVLPWSVIDKINKDQEKKNKTKEENN